ncbi:MAG: YHS domain-containing protein [Candidatus Cloacimonetes bacterium]|nr:YHS domain-containing protein [Candidatus Cloacimonadota bacterium]
MKKIIFIALLCLLVSYTLIAEESKVCHSDMNMEKAEKIQETCPVMGNPINKEIYTEYKGEKVYFCCEACINIFNNNPGKYLEKMQESQVEEALEFKQTKCPVMGMEIVPEINIEYKGEKIYFCCPSCIETFKANPEKHLEQLNKK